MVVGGFGLVSWIRVLGSGFSVGGACGVGLSGFFRVGALSYLFRLLSCLKPLIVFTY